VGGPHDFLLHSLRDALDELDAAVTLRLGEGGLPDQLYVELEPDAKGRVLHAQAMFLPGPLEVPILQTYVGLPYPVALDSLGALLRFLNLANANSPIGEFGYLETANLLYYRYNAAVRVDPFDVDLAETAIAMASYLAAVIGPIIEEVATRGAYDEAAEALSAVIAQAGEDLAG